MVPFWVLIIVRHLLFRVPKKGDPNFDNHPHDTALNQEVLKLYRPQPEKPNA